MIRDYEHFKKIVLGAQTKCEGVRLSNFRKQSPFQKRRYTSEHVFPEAWAYIGEGERGMVINGEDITTEEDVIRMINDGLL